MSRINPFRVLSFHHRWSHRLAQRRCRLAGALVSAIWVGFSRYTGYLKIHSTRDGIPPYTQIQLPPLVSQQPYDIHLHLVAPANENNFGLGNFMSSLTLTNAKNRTIAYVRRPVGIALECLNSTHYP